MSTATHVVLTDAQTSWAWPFRDVYMQHIPGPEENLYTRYGVCMGFSMEASTQQRIFRAVYGAYCVVPLRVSVCRNHIQQPLSAKALRMHRKDNASTYVDYLSANIPALRATLYTAAGGRSFCVSCPHSIEQLQGLCTPGVPRCSNALVLYPEDTRGTKQHS